MLRILKHSEFYSNLDKLELFYETDSTYVFRFLHRGYEHLKVKLPKTSTSIDSYMTGIIEDLIYETQLQKFIYDPRYVNQIHEELILINALDQTINGYLVI